MHHPTHPRRRPWPTVLLLVATALLLALLVVVLVAPSAGARALGGLEPSNYQTRVLAVRPPVPGVSVEVVDAGTRLRLVNTGPRDVVVLGYQAEPWLRVGPGGVFENSRSPTLQMAGPRRADSPPPAATDPGAPPSWRQVDRGRSVAWHDHRAHWEADRPPAQVRRAPGTAQVVIPNWTVKLRTGGRLVDVVGEVRWVPGPSPLPWLAGAALLAMAVVAATRTRRWAGVLAATLGLVTALDLVQVAGALAGAQLPAGMLLSLAPSAAGWVVAALAIRQLLAGRFESGLFQLLLAAGLLTVVGGLGDLGFLLRSQLAGGLPDWMVRVAVTAKIGLGLGALVAAGLRLRHLRVPARQRWAGLLDDLDPSFDFDFDSEPLQPGELEPPGARRLQVVDGRAARRAADERAAATVATVLPWPGTRRPGSFDDPDLPGGA